MKSGNDAGEKDTDDEKDSRNQSKCGDSLQHENERKLDFQKVISYIQYAPGPSLQILKF